MAICQRSTAVKILNEINIRVSNIKLKLKVIRTSFYQQSCEHTAVENVIKQEKKKLLARDKRRVRHEKKDSQTARKCNINKHKADKQFKTTTTKCRYKQRKIERAEGKPANMLKEESYKTR